MDPNAALKQLRELADIDAYHNMTAIEGQEFIELFKALDDWISKGGFLPEAWKIVNAD